jgi:hypothetical protein
LPERERRLRDKERGLPEREKGLPDKEMGLPEREKGLPDKEMGLPAGQPEGALPRGGGDKDRDAGGRAVPLLSHACPGPGNHACCFVGPSLPRCASLAEQQRESPGVCREGKGGCERGVKEVVEGWNRWKRGKI